MVATSASVHNLTARNTLGKRKFACVRLSHVCSRVMQVRLSHHKPTCFAVLLKAAVLSVERQILAVMEQPTSVQAAAHEAADQVV